MQPTNRVVQRAPNPPEFAQPRLSRVKRLSSPARGYKFGCVCSYMAGHYHEDAVAMTGHVGTNTPKFVPPGWGRPPFDSGVAAANQTKERAKHAKSSHEFRPFFCEFWCFSLGKQARFTSRTFCSGMPL